MCGFAGFVDYRAEPEDRPARLALLERMGALLAHRGPDEQRFYDGEGLSLVFRRLAIVDVAGGSQPIENEDRTRLIAVNGEIYNHQELRAVLCSRHTFRSRSDAEPLLHLFEEFGPAALGRVLGDFALVLWDRTARRLLLARDRAGVKPLFMARLPGLLLFASEPKALIAHPRFRAEMRRDDLDVDDGRLQTFLHGVDALPAGHYATHTDGSGFSCRPYWKLADHVAAPVEQSPEEFTRCYTELFADSVRRRLMGDVPVGVFLSGGVDSCAIVAAGAETGAELDCFTIVEPAAELAGDVDAARRLTHALGLRWHPLVLDFVRLPQELHFGLEMLEYFVWLYDWPRFELEWVFKYVLHRHARSVVPGLKVILSGQGADEFTGGYSNPYDTPERSWAEYLHSLPPPPADAPAEVDRSFSAEMLRRVPALQNHNLWHEDRSGMAHGIEVRVPFLDHRLLELLASVPSALHERLFRDKRIVRDAAGRWLGPEFTRRPKVRFFFGRDERPLARLYAGLVSACVPAFLEKYRARAVDSMSPAAWIALYEAAVNGSSLEASVELFHNMAGIIFAELSRTSPPYMPRSRP